MSEQSSPEKPTVADRTAAYALDAIDHAKASIDIDLDFSEASIEYVEAWPTHDQPESGK